MSLAFFPSKQKMIMELQQGVSLRKVEMLHSLCNCCTYKQFDYTMSRDCRSCNGHAGIRKIVREDKRNPAEGDELPCVC